MRTVIGHGATTTLALRQTLRDLDPILIDDAHLDIHAAFHIAIPNDHEVAPFEFADGMNRQPKSIRFLLKDDAQTDHIPNLVAQLCRGWIQRHLN